MSFIGMFRPLVKGIPPGEAPDRRPVLLLALGFTISATVLYAVLGLAGTALPDDRQVWLLAGAVMTALFVVDLIRVRSPFALGPSWRRQTPQRHTFRYGERRAALLWGLDTGLVFTTYRVTSLSWAALTVTALGLVPWWAGAAYALGFVLPLLVAVLLVPLPAGADPRTEPLWLVNRLYRSCGLLRIPAFVLLAAGTVGAALTAFA